MTKKSVDPVKAYLSRIGRTGGQAKSEAKTRANTVKARKRWAKHKTRKKKEQTNG